MTFRQIPGFLLDVEVWEKVYRALKVRELSGSHLHGILRELPLQTLRKQRQGVQAPGFSD